MTGGRPIRVAMVGWRGPRHPERGGAERYTLEVLAGLAARGMEVTWLVPGVPGTARAERIRGVRIQRSATRSGLLHALAAGGRLRSQRTRPDLVIDQVNAYPMLVPLFFHGPVLVLVHQLAQEVWGYQAPPPLSWLGRGVEAAWLRAYRGLPAVTVSPSTASDLLARGWRDVRVVPNAVEAPAVPPRAAPPEPPHFVALGRLVPMKRFEHALQALAILRRAVPGARLTLLGRPAGRYSLRLARAAARQAGVNVILDAPEPLKWQVLREATALVATSVREGWGIAVSEAHAVGTPSIAYRVPGLVDSTVHHVTGWLTEQDPASLAEAMEACVRDHDAWRAASRRARSAAAALSSDRTVAAFADAVEGVLLGAEERFARGVPSSGLHG